MKIFQEREKVITKNISPAGAGIASSASAFAALALAGSKAAGLNLTEPELSRLARRGSGSASRSIPSGYVEWREGKNGAKSLVFLFFECRQWNMCVCVVLCSGSHMNI